MTLAAQNPLPYLRLVRDCLRQQEPELWAMASTPENPEDQAKAVHLALLKNSYRLEAASHADLHLLVGEVAAALVPGISVQLYQAQGGEQRGASVLSLPGEAHILLFGDLAAFLSPAELRAVLAHELSHRQVALAEDESLDIAERALHALANEPQPESAHLHTLRRWRLYSEIQADRGSLAFTGDPELTITALLKTSTGMAGVQAAAYLRQAEEILASGQATSTGDTHPEVFVRALALSWSHRAGLSADATGPQPWQQPLPAGFALEDEIARLIRGPCSLTDFDILEQHQWTALTAAYWQAVLALPWAGGGALLNHARRYFPELTPGTAEPDFLERYLQALARGDSSLRDYTVGLLLELASADPELGDLALAQALDWAEKLGVRDGFRALASKELGQTKRALDKVFNDRQRLLSQGSGAP